MTGIDFFFDFVSPYSYLAFTQLEALQESTGEVVRLRPVSVRTIMKATNNTPTSITCPPKMTYSRSDIGRWARRYAVPLSSHPRFGQFSTEPFLKAAILAADTDQGMAFSQAAFEAIWVQSAAVEDETAMRKHFKRLVSHGGDFWDRREEANGVLQANAVDAVAAGAFGVPSFVTTKGLYFGNDRIEFLKEELAA